MRPATPPSRALSHVVRIDRHASTCHCRRDHAAGSHLDLPRINRPEQSLRDIELVPFATAVAAGVASVMVSHVVFEAFDPDRPATLSERIVPRLLREELGYDGLVLSDDMEMKAVMGRTPTTEQVWQGSRAGMDVFLVCRSHDLQWAFFEEIVRAQQRDAGFASMSADAERRVLAACRRLEDSPPPPGLEVVGCTEHLELAARARGEMS